jgi:hypothetical protein
LINAPAIDVFASTNPALGGLILFRFLEEYCKQKPEGADFPLLYLPIPIVLSSDFSESFKGTNGKTGFMEWLNRSPQIAAILPRRLHRTIAFSRQAVGFAIRHRILAVTRAGHLTHDRTGFAKPLKHLANDPIGDRLTRARRFGAWCSGMPNTTMIFLSLGFTK